MKYRLSLVLACSILTFFSQNLKDSKGNKTGLWIEYHANGKTPKYKGEFKSGDPIGRFVFYYETGEASMVTEYKPNKIAYTTAYHKNGAAMAVGKYVNQQKDSVWWYFNEVKEVVRQENYENGKLNGKVIKYFTDNKGIKNIPILEEINYVNGVEQGEWIRYYRDGKLQIKGNYSNGKQEGRCTWYYTSGKQEIIGFYKNGLKNGWWRMYDTNGITEIDKKYFHLGVELEGDKLEKHLEFKKKNSK